MVPQTLLQPHVREAACIIQELILFVNCVFGKAYKFSLLES